MTGHDESWKEYRGEHAWVPPLVGGELLIWYLRRFEWFR